MDWMALERLVDGVVGRSFSEVVQLSFMKNGRVDSTRSAVEIKAILHVDAEASGQIGAGVAGGKIMHVSNAAAPARLIINRGDYDGPELKVGDKLQALNRAGRPWFEVAFVDVRASGQIKARLNQA